MHHLSEKTNEKLQDLSLEELGEIFGGDNVTQSLFRYLGSVCAGIMAGQPHAAYGRYAGYSR